MKKFLALLLAAMMLLSCATAMAEETIKPIDNITNTERDEWWVANQNEGADISVWDTVEYDDGNTASLTNTNYDTTAELGTELWMQVAAEGQIDVTVPLVLVFQTNVDGGTAKTAEEYKITNNNNAEVVVTKVEFAKSTEGNGDTLMDMVPYSTAATALTENQYKAQLYVTSREHSANMTETTAVLGLGNYMNGTLVNGGNTVKVTYNADVPAENQTANPTNTGAYDMLNTSYEKVAKEGGLFKLNKTKNGTAATSTIVHVDMETGRLNFVTATKQDDNNKEVFDNTKGVHLLTATYTVAIDTSNQYGWIIDGANGQTLTNGATNVDNTAGSGTVKTGVTGHENAVTDSSLNIAANLSNP